LVIYHDFPTFFISTLYLLLWEDTENQKKKKMKNEELDKINIINDIKMKSNEEILKDITIQWERNCPLCDNIIEYKNKRCLNKAMRKLQVCRKCSRIGIKFGPMSDLHKEKISKHHLISGIGKWMLGRNHTDETKRKISNSNKGKIVSDKTKQKLSESKLGDKNPAKKFSVRVNISNTIKNNPRIISDETRRKLSIKSKEQMLKRIELLGITPRPNFSLNGCKYLDGLGSEKKWNIRHALNGGEKRIICYFVDGYDENQNVVIEYDEPRHYDIYGQLKEKDRVRMFDIISSTKCKFYRYNERKKELTQYDCN